MTIKTSFAGSLLRSSTAISALVIAGIATPAFAQDATNPAPPPETTDVATQQSNPEAVASQQPASSPAATTPAENNGREIVVTGTILRQVAKATPSPVTTINTEQLDRRGLSTVQDALQQLGSNNGPAITANFSTNGAFAQGASGASLRGLSTNSTLTLFDGLRAAYYPLADDGSRNFVDLNTIPDDIIDRVDVLRDGASSSYGADAIAGVINLITKREFSGLAARIEGGVSSRGDGDSRKASITAGVGDLATNGANAYISGFYYKADGILNKDRPYPFNTDDQSRICYNGVCGPNGIINGVNNDGTTSFNTYDTFYVRPRSATGGSVGVTRYNLLNGCNPGQTPYTLTPEQLADPNNAAAPANGQVCQTDFTNQFGHITGDIKRFGFSSRATVLIGDNHEAYALFNFMQTRTSSEGGAPVIRGNAPAGVFYPRFSTSTGAGAVAPGSAALALPIYVCPTGVGTANGVNTGCTATTPGAILNPYNPYAALGQTAQIIGRPSGLRTQSSTRNRAYRAALGFKGTVFGGWDYDLSATWMHTDLQTKAEGFFYIQNFLDAVARGQFNFLNPSATAPDILDRIAPDKINNNSSDLRQAQLIVGRELMQLPGGPLQLGLGATIFREAVNAPSANSDINGPTQRYFTLNAFGAKGSRVVKAVFAELEAPVMPWFSLNASGRYDHYSTGQSAFSPKLGFKLTPVRQVLFRGTWSKGFRIPAFAEANSFPTTGFVTASKGIYTDSFLAQYGCSLATYTSCPTYLTQATYGLTQVANENLKPEKSRSYTAGLLVEPIRNWSATVDYYNIKKTGAILFPETGPAIAAYYSGQPIPPGFVVIPDAPDPNNPTATPKIAFVEAGLVNAATQRVWGLDFGVQGRVAVTPGIRWITQGEASYIGRLETKFPSGNVERYDGTLGNFNLTAGSGTPKWKGYWANTLDFGRVQATGTVNYFGGYDLSAMDQGGDYKDCSLNPGYVPCKVKRYITFDVNAQVRLTDQVSVYGSVLNIFNKMPPIDPVTYGSHLFNAVQGGTGILGTYFKLGAKLDLAGPKLRVAEAEYVAPPPPPPPPPPAAPATVTCPDGLVILAGQQCPSPPPPPPPPPPAPERGY